MVLGSAGHSAIETNLTQKLATRKDLPLNDVTDAFADSFEARFESEEVVLEEGEKKGDLKDQGVELVSIHHSHIAPKIQPKLVEHRYELETENYKIQGYLDLVDESGAIVDTKFTGKKPNQEELDKDLQFTAYSLLYRANNGKNELGMRKDALVKTKKPYAIQVGTSRTDEDGDWFLGLADKFNAALDAGNFFPNPTGWWCSEKWCGYWGRCKGKSRTVVAVS